MFDPSRWGRPFQCQVTHRVSDVQPLVRRSVENTAFVGNTGHLTNAIDLGSLEGLKGMKVDNIEPQKFFSSSPLVTA